jgi:hypothetical protein
MQNNVDSYCIKFFINRTLSLSYQTSLIHLKFIARVDFNEKYADFIIWQYSIEILKASPNGAGRFNK